MTTPESNPSLAAVKKINEELSLYQLWRDNTFHIGYIPTVLHWNKFSKAKKEEIRQSFAPMMQRFSPTVSFARPIPSPPIIDSSSPTEKPVRFSMTDAIKGPVHPMSPPIMEEPVR